MRNNRPVDVREKTIQLKMAEVRKLTLLCRAKDAEIARLKAELAEAMKDASIIRKIREIRKGTPVGTPCGCEFDEEDNCLKRCALHDEVYKELAAAQNELDQYRKVVWWLDRYGAGWYLLDHKASVHNLDIPAMKKAIGQK